MGAAWWGVKRECLRGPWRRARVLNSIRACPLGCVSQRHWSIWRALHKLSWNDGALRPPHWLSPSLSPRQQCGKPLAYVLALILATTFRGEYCCPLYSTEEGSDPQGSARTRPAQGTSIQYLLQIKEGKDAMCCYINSYQRANVAFRYVVNALYLQYWKTEALLQLVLNYYLAVLYMTY